MIKLLFVINALTIGGSEKSLISLLNTIDYYKYEVDLLMLKKGEPFDQYVPKQVNVLEIPNYYKYINKEKCEEPTFEKIRYTISRYKSSIEIRLNRFRRKKLKNNQQIFYINQRNILKDLEKHYDVAIAFAQGFPTYFVSDKVHASKKLSWINCDYMATMYDKKLDKIFYDKIDNIVVVSDASKDSVIKVNREYERKLIVIKDIVNPELIIKMSNEKVQEFNKSEINILTVARLVMGYKGYDMAIAAANILRNNGYKFKWYAIGDGQDRPKIQKLIQMYNLADCFILLGSRENPYSYMRECDIYVQPSRKEGFGLAVIEAKILKKPIVCTNFNTAKELIDNEIDGLIVEQDKIQLVNGIKRYLEDFNFTNRILDRLKLETEYNSISEINKVYKLFE